MVKVGGNETHISLKYVKKTREFFEKRGEIVKVGGIIIFAKQGGNVLKQGN